MNIRRMALVTGLMVLAACGTSLAGQKPENGAGLQIDQWTLGPQIYYLGYKEPNFNVKIDGPMYGVTGMYTHHDKNNIMVRVGVDVAWGKADYSSTVSGSISDMDNFSHEERITAGYDFHPNDSLTLTPFSGIGFRFFDNDSSGRISSAGAYGYERESNYIYTPVGLEIGADFHNSWKMELSGEYDIFWYGRQESHLEDVASNFNTVVNDQSGGYGVRGSLKILKKGNQYDLTIEPFVRWWSIKDSQFSTITYAGAIAGYAYEPRNETLESGGKISLSY